MQSGDRGAHLGLAYVSIRQHASAYGSIRGFRAKDLGLGLGVYGRLSERPLAELARRCQLHLHPYVSIRQHPSASVSTRQHTLYRCTLRADIAEE
jgi:hypothetical protein